MVSLLGKSVERALNLLACHACLVWFRSGLAARSNGGCGCGLHPDSHDGWGQRSAFGGTENALSIVAHFAVGWKRKAGGSDPNA